jgi:hypothetical protein
MESSEQMLAHIMPISRGAKCIVYLQWAYEIIDTIHSGISLADWSLADCQERIYWGFGDERDEGCSSSGGGRPGPVSGEPRLDVQKISGNP